MRFARDRIELDSLAPYRIASLKRRPRSREIGAALVEFVIVVGLVLIPILAIVTDYSLGIGEYQKILRATERGVRAAQRLILSAPPNGPYPTTEEIFDAAENAVNDFLNSCNHLIPNDCKPDQHAERNYKLNIFRQDVDGMYLSAAIIDLARQVAKDQTGDEINLPSRVHYHPGIRVSLSRVRSPNFFGGHLGSFCATSFVALPRYLATTSPGIYPLECDSIRYTNPLNEEPYELNLCGARRVLKREGSCAEIGQGKVPEGGCGDCGDE